MENIREYKQLLRDISLQPLALCDTHFQIIQNTKKTIYKG